MSEKATYNNWRNGCEIGNKSEHEWWLRWTEDDGIYWWYHPRTGWVTEPEQKGQPTFATRGDAYWHREKCPVPPPLLDTPDDQPTPTQPERGQGGEVATTVDPTRDTIQNRLGRVLTDHGADAIRYAVAVIGREADEQIRAALARAKEAEAKLAEAEKFAGIHNAMCEALNALIDEHGGWAEDGGGTYAANFRRIIAAAESARDAARAELAAMRGRMEEPPGEMVVAMQQEFAGGYLPVHTVRAILRTAARWTPADTGSGRDHVPDAGKMGESEQAKRPRFLLVRNAFNECEMLVPTIAVYHELVRRLDALEAK